MIHPNNLTKLSENNWSNYGGLVDKEQTFVTVEVREGHLEWCRRLLDTGPSFCINNTSSFTTRALENSIPYCEVMVKFSKGSCWTTKLGVNTLAVRILFGESGTIEHYCAKTSS